MSFNGCNVGLSVGMDVTKHGHGFVIGMIRDGLDDDLHPLNFIDIQSCINALSTVFPENKNVVSESFTCLNLLIAKLVYSSILYESVDMTEMIINLFPEFCRGRDANTKLIPK